MALLNKGHLKVIIFSGIVILLISVLLGLIITFTPKYLEAKQSERDNSTKCKSYRALEEIAVSIYRSDPNGGDWRSKANEAETRRKQHKCSQVVIN